MAGDGGLELVSVHNCRLSLTSDRTGSQAGDPQLRCLIVDVPQVAPRLAQPAVPVTPHLPMPLPPPPQVAAPVTLPPQAPVAVVRVPPPAPAPVAELPEQPHPEWAAGSVTVLGPSYVPAPPDRWEPLRAHRTRILQAAAGLAVVALGATLFSSHRAGVRAEALKTVTADLQQVVQFEHMSRVYSDSYASRGQLLRNGWTPGASTLTFSVVPRSYCVTATLKGVTRTVREDEVISTLPC